MSERVLVAMSGGVDSSVAAALLKQRGCDVIGVALRLFDPLTQPTPVTDERGSRVGDPAHDARAVCDRLGIPFRALDCTQDFQCQVIQYFLDEYRRGRTPNPCVVCNPAIKFSRLLGLARELGAERIGTGHYARVHRDPERGRCLLTRGADRDKDQSYMLCFLEQRHLAAAVFPLGDLRKTQVRGIARDLGLHVHDRKASQEVCFVPDDDTRSFLIQRLRAVAQPGPIVDTAGRVLGRHKGVHLFTIGQRRGLGIALGRPAYVVRIDAATRTLVVGAKKETLASDFEVADVNWIAFDGPHAPFEAQVKIRYQHPGSPAEVTPLPGRRAHVRFHQPQSAITPGQVAALYQGDLVLGGGFIERVA